MLILARWPKPPVNRQRNVNQAAHFGVSAQEEVLSGRHKFGKLSAMADLKVEIQAGVPAGYSGLRRAVAGTLVAGQQKIEALKVQLYWQTGKMISDYLKGHPEDGGHGKGVVERLAADLNVERTVLYRILRFAQAFPNVARGQHLRWSHYRELISIEDAALRTKLANEVRLNGWPAARLREEILRRRKPRPSNSGQMNRLSLPEPLKGVPGTVQVAQMVSLEGVKRKVFDLGFSNYLEMTEAEKGRFDVKDMARWAKSGWVKAMDENDRWFYEADVERVVDGDTLLVQVHMPMGVKRRQYLRLLHINAQEKGTAAGGKARSWLAAQFKRSARVRFRSRKTDRYDRYLCDIWQGNLYLNAELLRRDLAVRA